MAQRRQKRLLDVGGADSAAAAPTAFWLDGREDDPVVVLIHGLGLNSDIWRDYVPALTAAGFRVLRYDLLGHGDSAPPPLEKGGLPLSAFAAQLRALLDSQGVARAALVGFSLGGMINRRFALDYPERVWGLVALNSPHERSAEEQRQCESRAARVMREGIAAGVNETFERWFTPEFARRRADYLAETRRRLLANDLPTYAECRKTLARGVAELIRPRPPLAPPMLAMTCENDRGSSPAMARAIGAESPAAKAQIVPELRHMGMAERPDLFLPPIIDFLAQATPAAAAAARRAG